MNEKGFAPVILLLLLVITSTVGVLSYKTFSNQLLPNQILTNIANHSPSPIPSTPTKIADQNDTASKSAVKKEIPPLKTTPSAKSSTTASNSTPQTYNAYSPLTRAKMVNPGWKVYYDEPTLLNIEYPPDWVSYPITAGRNYFFGPVQWNGDKLVPHLDAAGKETARNNISFDILPPTILAPKGDSSQTDKDVFYKIYNLADGQQLVLTKPFVCRLETGDTNYRVKVTYTKLASGKIVSGEDYIVTREDEDVLDNICFWQHQTNFNSYILRSDSKFLLGSLVSDNPSDIEIFKKMVASAMFVNSKYVPSFPDGNPNIWNTYNATGTGISFKYPSTWKPTLNYGVREVYQNDTNNTVSAFSQPGNTPDTPFASTYQDAFNKTQGWSIGQSESFDYPPSGSWITRMTVTKIGSGKFSSGEEYVLVRFNSNSSPDNGKTWQAGAPYYVASAIKGNTSYNLKLGAYNQYGFNIYQQILKTVVLQ